MKIHTGDFVVITTGKDKGKQGTVTRILHDKNRVVVEGINMRIRHIKKTPTQAGQRLSYEASIHASNVQILDPKTKKLTRIGFAIDPKTGKKKRIAKASGEVIEKAVVKAQKKQKTTAASVEARKAERIDGKVGETAPAANPVKQPFWKRGFSGGNAGSGADGKGPVQESTIQTAHRAQGG